MSIICAKHDVRGNSVLIIVIQLLAEVIVAMPGCLEFLEFRMLRVQKSVDTVAKHLGGTDALVQALPAVVFQWLEDAAEGAENLINNASFLATFHRFSQVDTMTPEQLASYGDLVKSAVKRLSGVDLCVAPLSREYALYVRPDADTKVDQSMKVYINAHLLIKMNAVMENLKSKIGRTELVMQFTSFLASKIFHELNHLLLFIVDDMDPSMNLIGIPKDGSACTPPKNHFGKTFNDFGSLMERACFGGILLLECWESCNLGTRVLLSCDETLKNPKPVPTIASVGKGELAYVSPVAEPVTGQKRAPSTSAGNSHEKDEGGGEEGSTNEEEDASVGEQLADRFLSVDQWPTARLQRRATARH